MEISQLDNSDTNEICPTEERNGEIEEQTNQRVEKAEREREGERSTCTCRFVMNAEAELASAVVRRGFEERTCLAIHAFMHPTAKVPDASLTRDLDSTIQIVSKSKIIVQQCLNYFRTIDRL